MRLSDARDARRAINTLYQWMEEERHRLLLECLADENNSYTTSRDILEEMEKVLQDFHNSLDLIDVCITHYDELMGTSNKAESE